MRAWAEIDLDAIAHNFKEIKRVTSPDAKIMAVIKADAYGHGFTEVAHTLLQSGAHAFAVATADEALQLRRAGFDVPVLILGYVFVDEYEELIKNGISLVAGSLDTAREISCAAKKAGKRAKIHIKLDTGMGRIGFVCGDDDESVADEICSASALDAIETEGIFSHFSKADETDLSYTRFQFERFSHICSLIERRGLNIPIKHICNSAGIIRLPEFHMDMVRAGIILYGLNPSDCPVWDKVNLKPAMTFKTKIVNIKNIKHESSISYGVKYKASPGKKIATIAVGYADGFSRILSNKASVLVRGKRAKVVGNICMDQCMIDVTDIEGVNLNDDVIIFGSDGNNTITVELVASLLGTISYEVVCSVGKRIPRIYIQNGKTVSILNYLL